MIRVECKCRTCKANAAALGVTAPLAAEVPAALAGLAKTTQGRHGLVYSAHDPSAVGRAVRARTGLRAA